MKYDPRNPDHVLLRASARQAKTEPVVGGASFVVSWRGHVARLEEFPPRLGVEGQPCLILPFQQEQSPESTTVYFGWVPAQEALVNGSCPWDFEHNDWKPRAELEAPHQAQPVK